MSGQPLWLTLSGAVLGVVSYACSTVAQTYWLNSPLSLFGQFTFFLLFMALLSFAMLGCAAAAARDYEGVMLRNLDAPYEHKRSYHLQKFKATSDAEFKVAGWQVDKDNGITWECQTSDGKMFHAKPDGPLADRVAAVNTAAEMVGKMLTIKFQELSDTGVPRFPVAVGFRVD